MVNEKYSLTILRAFLFFYAAAQIGSFSSLMTTTLEMHKGFPYAFLLPLPIFALEFLVLLTMNGNLVTFPPQGSTVFQSLKDLLTIRGKSSASNDLGTEDEIYSAVNLQDLSLLSLLLRLSPTDVHQPNLTSRLHGGPRPSQRPAHIHKPPHDHHLCPHSRHGSLSRSSTL